MNLTGLVVTGTAVAAAAGGAALYLTNGIDITVNPELSQGVNDVLSGSGLSPATMQNMGNWFAGLNVWQGLLVAGLLVKRTPIGKFFWNTVELLDRLLRRALKIDDPRSAFTPPPAYDHQPRDVP